MDETYEDGLKRFFEAFLTLLNVSRNYAESVVETQQSRLESAILLLERAKRYGKTVHIAGAGRSRLVGKIIGEVLKTRGLRVSVVGEPISEPVRKDDIILAVSASGWTNTTCYITEEGIKLGAKVIALTATPGSKLDRLSDISIYLPGKVMEDVALMSMSYILRKMMDKRKTPLAPMGTIPEINAFLVGVSLALAIDSWEPAERIRDSMNKILDNASKSYNNIVANPSNIARMVAMLLELRQKNDRSVFFVGAGINGLVSLMSAMRFKHLAFRVLPLDDWKFRRPDDMLIAISSSGESAVPLLYVREAKRSGLKVTLFTSNGESSMAKLADNVIVLEDSLPHRIEYLEYQVPDGDDSAFIPAFEFTALLTLESIVAQIADAMGILEDEMRRMHANIE